MRRFHAGPLSLVVPALGLTLGLTLGLAFGSVGAADGDMVLVAAGETILGDDQGELDERPRRRIFLPAFAIDRTEVTIAAYERCVAARRCQPRAKSPADDAKLPVSGVSFADAEAYCVFAGKRLPTEQEWEKAARGALGRRYPWGDEFDCARGNFGTFDGDGRCAEEGAKGRPLPVGSFAAGASPYGALDMAGNVWEWVAGRYDYKPLGHPDLRLLRGGGCCSIFGLPRSSDRLALPLSYRDIDIGFRCARSLAAGQKDAWHP